MNVNKSKKVPQTDNRMTLIAIHEKKIKSFQEEFEMLDSKKNRLEQLKNKYKSLRTYTNNEAHLLNKQIKELESEIIDIENREEQNNYLINASDYIKKYKQSEIDGSNKGTISKNYIVNCLGSGGGLPIEESKNKVKDFICKECGCEKKLNHKEATVVCENCGMIDEYQDNDICHEFSEEIEVLSPFSYKKINHFKEWLSMLLGRESSSPPESVINILFMEMKKDRITDKKQITPELIKGYLRKNKLNKMYEHTTSLMYRICKISPPNISKELEAKLISMFEQTIAPFEKHKPPGRKNFLSYGYVLYKLCELLDQKHLLKSFPLLKSREKLYEQDLIWSKICKDLDWYFYPSL